MEQFLFIPPVKDSLGSLTPWRWALLIGSFVASLALFALWMLMLANHVMWVWCSLLVCVWVIAKMPMQVYAQNSKGRLVGKLYLAIIGGYILYVGHSRIATHLSESLLLIILIVLLGLCWATYLVQVETAKVNEHVIRRIDALQSQLDSIESKVKRNV
jgi:hypothetical protein